MSAGALPVAHAGKVHMPRACPPWREHGKRTMCGLTAEGKMIVSPERFPALRDEEAAWVKSGRPRATCARYRVAWQSRWEKDPVQVIALDCPEGRPGWERGGETLRPELRALAALAGRHEKEFRKLLEAEAAMQALAQT